MSVQVEWIKFNPINPFGYGKDYLIAIACAIEPTQCDDVLEGTSSPL